MYTHTCVYVYIYIYTYMYVYICIYALVLYDLSAPPSRDEATARRAVHDLSTKQSWRKTKVFLVKVVSCIIYDSP